MNFSFGATAPTTAFGAAPAGFGFGTTSTQPAATGFSAFGQPAATAPATGFGVFGTTSTQPTFNAFAQPAAAAPAPAATGFNFLAPQQPAQPQLTLQQQQQLAVAQQQYQRAQFSAAYASSIEARFAALQSAYSPASPDCRFQTVFYNKVEPHTIAQYVKPPVANTRLWESAIKNNPDPAALVPSLAIGFEDLRKRISEQDKAALAFNTTLNSMSTSLESMLHGHEASTAAALQSLQRVHSQQSHRLLQLINRVDMIRSRDIIPRLKEELEYEHKLRVLERKLTQPSLQTKINELTAMVKLMEQKESASAGGASASAALPSPNTESLAWLQPDAPSAQQLFTFLQNQRKALEHVTNLLKNDQKDLETIAQVMNTSQQTTMTG